MTTIPFDSQPDASGYTTHLEISLPQATLSQVALRRHNSDIYALPATYHSLFAIRFVRFSLSGGKAIKDTPPTVLQYSGQNATPSTYNYTPTGDLLIHYVGLAPERVIQPGAVPYGPIDVTLRLSAPHGIDAGWINLDMSFTYPDPIPRQSAQEAWETRILYPRLQFHNDDMTVPGQEYHLLNPNGQTGGFVQLAQGLEWENGYADFPPQYPLVAQFVALYQLERVAAAGFAQGIAVSSTDESGHEKHFYDNKNPPFDASTQTTFALDTVFPLFFQDGQFVRPQTYTLSGGQVDGGFSGAQFQYRLRAFRREGETADAPVDWYDVANIYREWLRARRPRFYRRHAERTADAPLDGMDPYTIAINYSLDGPIGRYDGPPALRHWLEMHPLDTPPNMPDNPNETLPDLLRRLKQQVNQGQIKLEAQIWGFEMGGFYRFLGGYPPISDVFPETPYTFRQVMDRLTLEGIYPQATSGPCHIQWHRQRYRGHLRQTGADTWEPFILLPFPAQMTAHTCATTSTPENNRLFQIESGCDPYVSVADATRKVYLDGSSLAHGGISESKFYDFQNVELCPVPGLEQLYANDWVRDRLLHHGFRLLEFMLHPYRHSLCYSANHQHIVGSVVGLPFDNAAGFGPWYARRLQQMLAHIQEVGQAAGIPYFTITNEFLPPEHMVPYFTDWYDHTASTIKLFQGDTRSLSLRATPEEKLAERWVPFWQHVYSEMMTAKMNMVDVDVYNHPGYLEKTVRAVPPSYMLAEARDDDTAASLAFETWRQQCEDYFAANFAIVEHGVAPAGYPTNSGTTYTYKRGVQDVFNLRARFFRFGAAAVRGERILVPAAWIEAMVDAQEQRVTPIFNQELLHMAGRAVQFQQQFKTFFRQGFMLGAAHLVSGNKSLYAWYAKRRQFIDVPVLVEALYPGANAQTRLSIFDAFSRGIDAEHIQPLGVPRHPSDTTNAIKIATDQIQHMVWQYDDGPWQELLYAFANVGNRAAAVTVEFSRGLDTRAWQGTVVKYTPAGASQSQLGTATRGQMITVEMPPRSFAGIHLTPLTPAPPRPTGLLETIGNGGIAGGHAQGGQGNGSVLTVHFYIDGAAGAGTFVGTTLANLFNAHRFLFVIPDQFRDGRPHTLFAYAQDADSGDLFLLSGAPRLFEIQMGAQPPAGWIDGITAEGLVVGWCLDPDAPTVPVFVDIYIDHTGPGASPVTRVTANQRRPILTFPGDRHGFTFSIPLSYWDGQPHLLYTYGIDLESDDPHDPDRYNHTLLTGDALPFQLTPTLDGSLTGILNGGIADGYASDPAAPAANLVVQFYADGTMATGELVGSMTANLFDAHRFLFVIPDAYRDGQPHTLYAYAQDMAGAWHLLPGSSYPFTIQMGAQPPAGWAEDVSNDGVARGWCLDPDAADVPVFVDIYIDDVGTGSQPVAHLKADEYGPILTFAGTHHRFSFPLPIRYWDGQTHNLYVFGIDLELDDPRNPPGYNNTLLDPAPLPFRLPFTPRSLPITALKGVSSSWQTRLAQYNIHLLDNLAHLSDEDLSAIVAVEKSLQPIEFYTKALLSLAAAPDVPPSPADSQDLYDLAGLSAVALHARIGADNVSLADCQSLATLLAQLCTALDTSWLRRLTLGQLLGRTGEMSPTSNPS